MQLKNRHYYNILYYVRNMLAVKSSVRLNNRYDGTIFIENIPVHMIRLVSIQNNLILKHGIVLI